VRLRFLAEHLHSLGARALHGFIEMMLAGEMPDGLAVMDVLERHAKIDPLWLWAIGGYDWPEDCEDEDRPCDCLKPWKGEP
jgi:hypothetical protein